MITPIALKDILQSLRQPEGYVVQIISVVQHGQGLVVLYDEHAPDGRLDHRCAGFDGSQRKSFDMIVSKGAR